jgi:hypothetical protein
VTHPRSAVLPTPPLVRNGMTLFFARPMFVSGKYQCGFLIDTPTPSPFNSISRTQGVCLIYESDF